MTPADPMAPAASGATSGMGMSAPSPAASSALDAANAATDAARNAASAPK